MKSPNSRLPTPCISAHREARYIYKISADYGGTGRKFLLCRPRHGPSIPGQTGLRKGSRIRAVSHFLAPLAIAFGFGLSSINNILQLITTKIMVHCCYNNNVLLCIVDNI